MFVFILIILLLTVVPRKCGGNNGNCIDIFVSDLQCRLLMLYTQNYEVGIYAGVDIGEEETIETGIGIPITSEATQKTELAHYIQGLNSTHNLVTLGYAMLYNHSRDQNAQKYYSLTQLWEFYEPFGASIDIGHRAARKISKGEQLFSFYGDDWFSAREQEEIIPSGETLYSFLHDAQRTMIRIPGCPHSLAQIKNGRVYASKKIFAGDIVEVSRVLLLDESALRKSGPIEHFVWNHPRPIVRPLHRKTQTTFVLLLLGNGALYQSPPKTYEGMVNPSLTYSWWTEDCVLSASQQNIDKGNARERLQNEEPLEVSNNTCHQSSTNCKWSPLKKDCTLRMFISFRANKNILPGEELTVQIFTDPVTKKRYTSTKFPAQCFTS